MRGAARFLVVLGAGVILAGCTPAWQLYEVSEYTVFRTPGVESFEAHARLLARVIDQAESQKQRPPPGICAEHAFYLWRLGHIDEAVAALEKEERYYPESRVFAEAQRRLVTGGGSAIEPPAAPREETGGGTGDGDHEP
jgi:hypothetical protein